MLNKCFKKNYLLCVSGHFWVNFKRRYLVFCHQRSTWRPPWSRSDLICSKIFKEKSQLELIRQFFLLGTGRLKINKVSLVDMFFLMRLGMLICWSKFHLWIGLHQLFFPHLCWLHCLMTLSLRQTLALYIHQCKAEIFHLSQGSISFWTHVSSTSSLPSGFHPMLLNACHFFVTD